MRRVIAFLFVLGSAFSILLRGPATAQMYRYTDEKGEVHFVDSPEKIPEADRDKAMKEDPSAKSGTGEVTVVPSERGAASGDSDSEPVDRSGKTKKKTCSLRFPKKDKRDEGRSTVYFGTVANRGTGTARVVQVTFETFDRREKVLDSISVYVQPKDLGPNETGSFEIVLDASKRERQTKNVYYYGSRFKASYTRCD